MSSRVPANCFHNLLFFHLTTRDFGLNYFHEKQNNIQRLFILNNGDFEKSDLIKKKYFRDGKYYEKQADFSTISIINNDNNNDIKVITFIDFWVVIKIV